MRLWRHSPFRLTRRVLHILARREELARSTEPGTARVSRITTLVARATDEDTLTAALAASSADELADARTLLDLAAHLLLDRQDLLRLRLAFLVADADEDEDGL